MSLRPKTKVRLVLIFGICAAIVGTIFVVRRSQVAREAQRLENLRRDGMNAYTQGDYTTALNRLNEYIVASKLAQEEADDLALDALFALADSRGRIRLDARGRHIAEARDRLERYRLARPKDEKALRLIMTFNAQTLRHREVVQTANDLLNLRPNDSEALLAKATALTKLQSKPESDQARQTLEQLLKQEPNSFRGRLLALELKLNSGATAEEVMAQAARDRVSHPGNGVFDLIFARAAVVLSRGRSTSAEQSARQAGWLIEARRASIAASQVTPPDADFAVQVVYTLEKTRAFPEAVSYARSAVDRLGVNAGDELTRVLMQRLWQTGQYDEVISRTAKLNPKAPQSPTELLAYRALSILGLLTKSSGSDSTRLLNDLDAVTAGLTARETDLDAQGWVLTLQADRKMWHASSQAIAGGKPAASPAELVSLYKQAIAKDPVNIVAATHRGDAMALAGETEAAVRDWQTARQWEWEWAYPLARLASLSLRAGQFSDAISLANEALERQPGDHDYEVLLVKARFLDSTQPQTGAAPATAPATQPAGADLLTKVRTLLDKWPADDDLLPIEISLIARLEGTSAATARLKQILTSMPALSPDTLMQLLAADSAEKLGMAGDIESALLKLPGGPIRLAGRNASDLLARGQAAQGLKLLLDTQKQLDLNADSGWLMMVAAYRDRAEDPDAPISLATVADRWPQDISVQLQALSIPVIRRDRELWRRTIDRVRTLSGDETTRWKSERAQWILSGSPTPAERKDAVQLLSQVVKQNPDSADAHRLLGKALAADKQFDRASSELVSALKQWPNNPTLVLEIAEALRLANKPADAVAQLSTLSLEKLPLEHALRAAQMYEQLGRPDRGIEVLKKQPPTGPIDAKLGRLYRLDGRMTDAEAAYRRTLNAESVTAFDLAAGAEFFASRQNLDFARLFLDRLRVTSPSPAVAEVLLGRFESQFGTPELAAEHFRQATEIDPKSANNWKELVGYFLRIGQLDDADRAADAGLKASTSSADLGALKSVIRLARRVSDVQWKAYVGLLIAEPQHEAALATLTVLADAGDSVNAAKGNAAQTGAALALLDQKLSDLADRYRDFWLLQKDVIRRAMNTGRPEVAAALAVRAMSSFPADPEPAFLAADANQRCGRWAAAIEAAQAWRARSGVDTLAADVLLASLQLSQRRGDPRALDRLSSLVQANPLPTPGHTTLPATPRPATLPGTLPLLPTDTVQPTVIVLYRVYGQALIEAGRIDEATAALEPLLSQGDPGWTAWMQVSSSFRDVMAARRWIDRGVASLSTVQVGHQLNIAAAKMRAAESTGDEELLKQSVAELDAVLRVDPKSVPALSMRAMAAHQQRQYSKAVECWRAVRSQIPYLTADIANNLAYALILAGDPKDVSEAAALSQQAVKASPDSAIYLSTLARTQTQDKAAAIATYRRALTKEPDCIEAIIGLADELAKAGKSADRNQVRELVSRARRLIEQGQATAAESRLILQSLENTLGMTDPKP